MRELKHTNMLFALAIVLGVGFINHPIPSMAQQGCISHPLPTDVVDKILDAAGVTLDSSNAVGQDNQKCHSLEAKLGIMELELRSHKEEFRILAEEIKEELTHLREDRSYDRWLRSRDCSDLSKKGVNESGVYTIFPGRCDDIGVRVWCDMESNGGGWTQVLSRRPLNNQVNFNRNWQGYKEGFGDPRTEYWIGNEILHLMTDFRPQVLRVDMEDWDSNKRYAQYTYFQLEDEGNKYKLHLGEYSGNAGDTLKRYHNDRPFSTWDNDNDSGDRNCGRVYAAGFWYHNCYHVGATHPLRKKETNSNGITWYSWYPDWTSLKEMTFKIRPVKIPRA